MSHFDMPRRIPLDLLFVIAAFTALILWRLFV